MEYFNNLDFDRTIGLLGFVLTIYSVYYAYTQNKKNRIARELKLDRGQTFSIFKDNSAISTPELKLMWNSRQVGNIYLLTFFLKNSGTISLKQEDFLKSITVDFREDIEILKTKVFSTSEYSQLRWTNSKNKIYIDVQLFESKKLIKTEIIYTGDTMSPVNIDVAILDGNIEKFTVDGKGRNNTDIAMDTKLYSIDSYYVGVFAYFMFPMTILVIVFALLHLIGLSLSPLTLLLIAIPATIIGFHKIGNNYSESMEFRNVNNWIEFSQEI